MLVPLMTGFPEPRGNAFPPSTFLGNKLFPMASKVNDIVIENHRDSPIFPGNSPFPFPEASKKGNQKKGKVQLRGKVGRIE